MVYVSVSVCLCAHVWSCAIYKPNIFGMYANWAEKCKMWIFKKIRNFKNIIDRGIIFALWVAPV